MTSMRNHSPTHSGYICDAGYPLDISVSGPIYQSSQVQHVFQTAAFNVFFVSWRLPISSGTAYPASFCQSGNYKWTKWDPPRSSQSESYCFRRNACTRLICLQRVFTRIIWRRNQGFSRRKLWRETRQVTRYDGYSWNVRGVRIIIGFFVTLVGTSPFRRSSLRGGTERDSPAEITLSKFPTIKEPWS